MQVSLNLRRPFTSAQAREAGLSRGLLAGPKFRRVVSGVYVEAGTPDSPWTRAAAALAVHPGTAHISHTTAAQLMGLPVAATADVHVTVLNQRDRRPRAGLACHTLPGSDYMIYQGLRVSPPLQQFIELAGILNLVELVVVGDAMIRQLGLTREQIVAYCAACSGDHAAAARRAAAYVRAEVDSPTESLLRMLIVLAGLPEPTVNVMLRDDSGVVVYRLDMGYPDIKLATEYDGRQHADDSRQWHRDILRREELESDGWRLVVITSPGIYRDPLQTLTRVRDALVARGVTGLPRRFSAEWRRFFPPR
ncbi:hypothetical protein CLV47_1046 [Antricoccus suffuscus]|uniref:DUF559 domain-containing protein n=1 Tax=Antricoccus suffuscus TaxID=1629062 RepID=A0A2T1A238_9ACTN|nr:hypothetical protein [Antricoccus suffuscus]PRZ42662.1 hypothetical protein CLV47_1046 [Antricoccus suffuscus]